MEVDQEWWQWHTSPSSSWCQWGRMDQWSPKEPISKIISRTITTTVYIVAAASYETSTGYQNLNCHILLHQRTKILIWNCGPANTCSSSNRTISHMFILSLMTLYYMYVWQITIVTTMAQTKSHFCWWMIHSWVLWFWEISSRTPICYHHDAKKNGIIHTSCVHSWAFFHNKLWSQ